MSFDKHIYFYLENQVSQTSPTEWRKKYYLNFPFTPCHKKQENSHIVHTNNYVGFHHYAGEHLIEDESSMLQTTLI